MAIVNKEHGSETCLEFPVENALQKKITSTRLVPAPIAHVDRLAILMNKALEDRIEAMLKSSVVGTIETCEIRKLSGLIDETQEPAILGELQFDGTDIPSMVNMSADLAFHIIDLRMGGDPNALAPPVERGFTSIDRAICEDVLTQTARSFEVAVESVLAGELAAHFSLADIQTSVADLTTAKLSADVLRISVALEIGSAERRGAIQLVIPLSVLDFTRAAVKKAAKKPSPDIADIWQDRMVEAVANAQVPLTAVLARTYKTYTAIQKLQVGSVISLPLEATQSVDLEMKFSPKIRFKVAQGRLGAYNEFKVLKLNAAPDARMLDHLRMTLMD
jgi:flagellar motor switch protein FliM